jgi:hypothetical protein
MLRCLSTSQEEARVCLGWIPFGLGRWTAEDLILSLLVAATAALLVVAVFLEPEQATRRAVTVQQLSAAYHGPPALVDALNGGEAHARALGRADLDTDGAPDLVVGYASHGAGIVTIQRGNRDAFAPKQQSVFEQMQRGSDPESFSADARAVRVPELVSYVQAGEFNRDKRPDVLAAARGGGLYLLAGDGHGGLGPAKAVALPGPVTTLAPVSSERPTPPYSSDRLTRTPTPTLPLPRRPLPWLWLRPSGW